MNFETFLNELRNDPDYKDQIVHVRSIPARQAVYAEENNYPEIIQTTLKKIGIDRLYCHQAEALTAFHEGKNVLVTTGTSSGKTYCYTLPLIELLHNDNSAKALLLFPTKALCQDQFKNFSMLLESAGLSDINAGVYDGDTPSALRRKLRDSGSVIFSNPDMVHASLMSQHSRWMDFISGLRLLVLDEMHTYSGIFGSNMAIMFRRFFRICRHYGSDPKIIASSATIANPDELAEGLTGREFHIVDNDGSPRGEKTFVFWNPPVIRNTASRSRRSANVEAHELMTKLIQNGIATITFSKAKMTAEMIHRYVHEKLLEVAPNMISRITPYRGGYLAEERREIEKRLFSGELIGVSTTSALELGIDVGTLAACIMVGYPGRRASFFQQAGRAGRRENESIVFLVGLDTSVNQFIMNDPGYIFDKSIEHAVIDPENPFALIGQLRCAAYEMPLSEEEIQIFGQYAEIVLRVLTENLKLKKINRLWYHSSSDIPNHEISLRAYAEENVVIEDIDTGKILGEVNKYDAEPLIHPDAVYMHLGDTYLVTELDMERNKATARREDVDYYTQPMGGTDVHHIDNQLREKPFGTGKAYWGEVTAYFRNYAYERINFYSLDAVSTHGLNLPTLTLETMAFWIVPTEDLMEKVRQAGFDPHNGLRGIGYGTRIILPLFMTCDTLHFSHSVGCVNSPWNAVFVYERYPHGMGFTEKAYRLLDRILPKVLENIINCPCEKGCPSCVGKPLRQYTTWSVDRGEASIPNKHASSMILEGFLGDMTNLNNEDFTAGPESDSGKIIRLEQALRRKLERKREPKIFHPIKPTPEVTTGFPEIEKEDELAKNDVQKRGERRRDFNKKLQKKISEKFATKKSLSSINEGIKEGLVTNHTESANNKTATDVYINKKIHSAKEKTFDTNSSIPDDNTIKLGDDLASRARRLKKKKSSENNKG